MYGHNIVDFNGTSDYVEVYGRINVDSNITILNHLLGSSQAHFFVHTKL
jgi:hypothetical protein